MAEGRVAGTVVSYPVSPVATGLSFTLVEVTSSRCGIAVVYILVVKVVRTSVIRVRRDVGATLVRSVANCIVYVKVNKRKLAR